MLKKSIIIILIEICVIIVASVFCYAIFVKPEPNIPVQSPMDNDNIIENKTKEDDITKDWQVYRNEEFGFEIKYPKDWKVSDGFRPIVFSPKDISNYTVSINSTYLNIDILDIDKEIEYYKNKGTFISEFKIENGACIKFKAQTKGGEIPAAFMIGKNHTIYINYEAFGTFSNDEYNQYKKVYDQMLSTFKFIE